MLNGIISIMTDETKEITYFGFCGETNTMTTLKAARRRCDELGIRDVIIASETGRSAIKALKVFNDDRIRITVVTHYPSRTWGPNGEIPIGLNRKEYSEFRKTLEENGVRIIQGTRPFAPPARGIQWDYPVADAMIDYTLELFSSGTKIAIETALMATDAGAIEEGTEIVSCGGTFKGLDTALVVKTAHSEKFFREFEVREIITKPRYRTSSENQWDDEKWRGDLNKYHTSEP